MRHFTPKQTYEFLLSHRDSAFIDCRSDAEFYLVGHPTLPTPDANGVLSFAPETLWRPVNICYSDDMKAEVNPDSWCKQWA
jgi:hypothetical protein